MTGPFENRLEKVLGLVEAFEDNGDRLIAASRADINFSHKDVSQEVAITGERLRGCRDMKELLSGRSPVCSRPGQMVAVMFSYNGATWLSTVISSIYLAGNSVRVKFSSKCSRIASVYRDIFEPLFGEEITFDDRSGPDFMAWAISSPDVPAIILFGSEATARPYEKSLRSSGKTFIFEGPGKDPFIVFDDADLDKACADLVQSKYWYSGQTCTAPERIYIQRAVHDEFLERFVEASRKLRVGPGDDARTDIAPLGSKVVLSHVREQINDARKRGGKVVLGGSIDGLLVPPTIIADANHEMQGMREETFGPVSFIMPFEGKEEAYALAVDNRYGLRASVWGVEEAGELAGLIRGESYLQRVPGPLYGRFGTVSLNEPRLESWRGAFITKAIGGYGDSGWVWKTEQGRFIMFQGPKLMHQETTEPGRS